MTRKCSHCSNNGHNSRTCPNRGVKLFGVRLTDGSIKKSASMGNLSHYNGSTSGGGLAGLGGSGGLAGLGGSGGLAGLGGSGGGGGGLHKSSSSNHLGSSPGGGGETPEHGDAGYASEDFVKGSSSSCRERKKGVPWTEEEHRMFLLGLQKLGKGDWRGIARNYVISRTPTQVASHAQKYFIRQTNMSRRKRRSSLFDMIADEPADAPQMISHDLFTMSHPQAETQGIISQLPAPPVIDEECESMDSTNSTDGEAAAVLPNPETSQSNYPVVYPAYFSPFFPFPSPYWPGYTTEAVPKETHEVVKPTAVHSKSPINVDELVGMSKLSLGESIGNSGPSPVSLKLDEGSNRQSAFHPNPGTSSSSSSMNSSPIHAL